MIDKNLENSDARKMNNQTNKLKCVNPRVRTLLENCAALRHRALFIVVGDRGRHQVANIHWALSKIMTNSSDVESKRIDLHKRILWCLADKGSLGFSSNPHTRTKQKSKKVRRGQHDEVVEGSFEAFLSTVKIRYTKYKDTENILGLTFGMCVLQNFEAITPNILCRTMETVQGGGVCFILLSSMTSLRQLYHLAMDSHRKYRNVAAMGPIRPLFNERFILSLRTCESCLVVDDELNILPICHFSPFTQSMDIIDKRSEMLSVNTKERQNSSCTNLASLVKLAVTTDQAKIVKEFSDILATKNLNITVALTAARGRGKSAALGLATAAAIVNGFSNIFLSAPVPQNVSTVFEFAQKGLEACGLVEHKDFQMIQESSSGSGISTTGNRISTAGGTLIGQLRKSNIDVAAKDIHQSQKKEMKHIIRINVFHNKNRQTIQFIFPEDYKVVHHQAELLIIDEAAAIPLPIVRNMLGNYLVFMSSTVNGYEGTGRALSLKLISELKTVNVLTPSNTSSTVASAESPGVAFDGSSRTLALGISDGSRQLLEMTLQEPIRYAKGDSVEKWLNSLLCLNATEPYKLNTQSPLASPKKCQLFCVNREALFSFHKASELFLHKLMSLFVSSHYKNTPNDLLLLSDAPSHYIFVLLQSYTPDYDSTKEIIIPDIYCAIHVAMEGALNKEIVRTSLSRGMSGSGDLVPWTLSKYFCDEDFASLNGARIVRIATHPSLQRMGYATEALRQLSKYFDTSTISLQVNQFIEQDTPTKIATEDNNEDLLSESLVPRETSPLLSRCNISEDVLLCPPLSQATTAAPLKQPLLPHQVDYISSSFGLTAPLYRFWRGSGFYPVYLRHFQNDITGEYSMIVLRPTSGMDTSESGDNTVSQIIGNSDIRETFDVQPFVQDFRMRFLRNLGGAFSALEPQLVLSVLEPIVTNTPEGGGMQQSSDESGLRLRTTNYKPVTAKDVLNIFSHHDLYRLERYAKQLVDYTLVSDILPQLTVLAIQDRMPNLHLTYLQCAILISTSLQGHSVENTASSFNMPVSQLFSLFNKATYRIQEVIQHLLQAETEVEMQTEEEVEKKKKRRRLQNVRTRNGKLIQVLR